jgi:trimethylamine:corrinoid methyltransferase-like protein
LCCLLNEAPIKEIFQQSLRVLEESGVDFEDEEALAILKAQGATVRGSNVISIPKLLVEEALKVTPESLAFMTVMGNQMFI